MNITHFIGALVISAFMLLNVLAMYLYMRHRLELDPHSPINHAIAQKFDSVDELRDFHQQEIAAIKGHTNAALVRYQSVMGKKLTAMDPTVAALYPQPGHRV